MPMTATVDVANARVDLFADWVPEPGVQTFGSIFRRVGSPSAPDEMVRGLFLGLLTGEQAYASDHEAPLDVQIWYVAASGPENVVLVAGPVTIPSNGYVWLKDPGRPWADIRLDLCATQSNGSGCETLEDDKAWVGFGTKTRAMDAGLFGILGKERPADVYARRKDINSTMSFLTRSLTAIDDVYELFTAGGPLLVQTQAVYGMQNKYGETDRYFQPGDLSEAYISRDQRKPWRLWSAPIAAVDIPIGEPQGTDTANWCIIEDTYPTFADLTETGYTWGQVASGEGSTPPVSGLYGGGLYGDGPYGG